MYPGKFDYVRAGSVAEAVTLLASHENARLLAGGHSLLPAMKLRVDMPATLIDIGRIPELKGISGGNGSVRIGALATHAEVAASEHVPAAVRDAAGQIGDPQVRNRGTIGGSIAHADPAADMPTPLVALDATLHLTGPDGDRSVAATDFFIGLFETAKQPGEVLVAVEVQANDVSAYVKMANPASGYAMVGASAILAMDGSVCKSAAVAVGGVTTLAIRTPSVEAALVGSTLDATAIEAAARAVQNDLGSDIMEDIHASAEYRKAMATVYVKRALAGAVARA